MRHGGQDLTKRTGGIKDESIIAWISHQICRGLHEIHSRAQIHRDIKPSNILLNSQGDVKVPACLPSRPARAKACSTHG